MADDDSIIGGTKRPRLSAEQHYEISAFASRHGISTDEAKRIIEEHGSSREAADAAAERLKVT